MLQRSPLFDHEPGPAPGWIGAPQHFAWLESIVKCVLVLNVVDAVLTMIWIAQGLAVEANPILADMVHEHPFSFVTCKLSLVSMGSLLLWRHRTRASAVVATFLAFIAYFLLFLYHLQGMDLQLVRRFLP